MSDTKPTVEPIEWKRIVIDEDGLSAEGISPHIAILAAECAEMLNKASAENYLQFDMLPSLDKSVRAIRVTVQWANGKSPAQRVTELLAANEALQAQAQGGWVQCDIETKSNLISRAQFRGITEQGFGLFRRVPKEQSE